MNAGDPPRRRIVITLDSGRVELGDLERMTRLALSLDAELEGIFVEDSDLLRVTESSFARELRPTSARAERFQPGRVHRELRVLARRAERTLAEYAERRGVRWSFRTWRGSIERELLSGLEADVLALTRLGAVLAQPVARRARELISAYFDGSEQALRVLATASAIAGDADRVTLQVLLAHSPEATTAELRQLAGQALSDYHGHAIYRSLTEADLSGLLQVLHESRSCALVITRGHPLLHEAPLRAYLSRLRCPLFLVR